MPAVEQSGIVERVTELSQRAALGTPIEIVDVQLRGAGKARLLRIYIDKAGGVTHGDCEMVSRKLGQLLDSENAIPGDSYTLEVSSPGVERKLKNPRDFERVVGQRVKIALQEPVEGLKSISGTLIGFTRETLELEMAPGQAIKVPLGLVLRANLKFDW